MSRQLERQIAEDDAKRSARLEFIFKTYTLQEERDVAIEEYKKQSSALRQRLIDCLKSELAVMRIRREMKDAVLTPKQAIRRKLAEKLEGRNTGRAMC